MANAGALQTAQEVTRLAVRDELSIEHHPQLSPVEGRNSPLGTELETDRLGHVANVTGGSDKYLILLRHVLRRPPNARPSSGPGRGDHEGVPQLVLGDYRRLLAGPAQVSGRDGGKRNSLRSDYLRTGSRWCGSGPQCL